MYNNYDSLIKRVTNEMTGQDNTNGNATDKYVFSQSAPENKSNYIHTSGKRKNNYFVCLLSKKENVVVI